MRIDRQTMTFVPLLLCSVLVLGCSVDTKGLAPLDAAGDSAPPAENTSERCQDGQDNDGDGKTDCADEQCAIFVACGPDPFDLFSFEALELSLFSTTEQASSTLAA